MNLLSYLRFKVPGLILDYDSLDKDFFSKDKIVVARTVYAMNDVKLNCAKEMNTDDENLAMALAVYLLGFSTYNGFSKVAGNVVDDVDENALKRIYEYARQIVKKD